MPDWSTMKMRGVGGGGSGPQTLKERQRLLRVERRMERGGDNDAYFTPARQPQSELSASGRLAAGTMLGCHLVC